MQNSMRNSKDCLPCHHCSIYGYNSGTPPIFFGHNMGIRHISCHAVCESVSSDAYSARDASGARCAINANGVRSTSGAHDSHDPIHGFAHISAHGLDHAHHVLLSWGNIEQILSGSLCIPSMKLLPGTLPVCPKNQVRLSFRHTGYLSALVLLFSVENTIIDIAVLCNSAIFTDKL